MRDMLIKFVVLFLADLTFRARPQSGGAIDALFLVLVLFLHLHHNGDGNVVGILLDDRAQAVAIEQFIFALAQV